MSAENASAAIELCASGELAEGGLAVSFDVVIEGEHCRAFAIRFEGRAHAYLNRCTHVAMELDWQPNRFFDDTGEGVAGPCQGGLLKIELTEADGVVWWHPTQHLQPLSF